MSPPPSDTMCQGPAHNLGSQSGFLVVTEVDFILFTYPWFPQLLSEGPTFFFELLEEYISLEILFSAFRNPAFCIINSDISGLPWGRGTLVRNHRPAF